MESMITPNQLFILGILFSIIGFLGVWILNDAKNSITDAKDSIQELNVNVAVVVKTVEYHDQELKDLKLKISDLYSQPSGRNRSDHSHSKL